MEINLETIIFTAVFAALITWTLAQPDMIITANPTRVLEAEQANAIRKQTLRFYALPILVFLLAMVAVGLWQFCTSVPTIDPYYVSRLGRH
ncbi:uncharacterized protein LY89DRAFT_691616 [Mollisia scopiformis]|uniref:Uncharacterized protein n=1 Tax=Mollisia scopiformis TaxID=149040 RepID=A0A132B5J9_MOLSC|nr:uncharacterized protein LY89DRAFT_691616 [Mollisia scopiformis]KUJ07523.1 hypothetical protein LY89DRAFT_691616 [Mollisia scopiformis]